MKKKYPCNVCGKNTLVSGGWHLNKGLNFCGNLCVTKYIENNMLCLWKRVLHMEKKIVKLEKKVKAKAVK